MKLGICNICGKQIIHDSQSSGEIVIVGQKKNLYICKSCTNDVYRDNIRYNVDVMIVPVSEGSFEATKKEMTYIIPAKWLRTKPKTIAFYQSGCQCAITHFAIIKNIQNSDVDPKISRLLELGKNKKWSTHKKFAVIDLEELISLKEPIKRNNSPPLQNRTYKTFSTFVAAKELRDLFDKK